MIRIAHCEFYIYFIYFYMRSQLYIVNFTFILLIFNCDFSCALFLSDTVKSEYYDCNPRCALMLADAARSARTQATSENRLHHALQGSLPGHTEQEGGATPAVLSSCRVAWGSSSVHSAKVRLSFWQHAVLDMQR